MRRLSHLRLLAASLLLVAGAPHRRRLLQRSRPPPRPNRPPPQPQRPRPQLRPPAPTAAPAAKPTTPPAPAANGRANRRRRALSRPPPPRPPASNLTGTLKVDTISEIESPHPFFASQLVGISVRMNVYDSLVDREWDGKIVPRWPRRGMSSTIKQIDFKLRQGVKFHNGADVTAADVKASMDHLLDKDIKSPTTSIFASVKGIEVIDPQTVRLMFLKTDARVFDLSGQQLRRATRATDQRRRRGGHYQAADRHRPYKFVEWSRTIT